LNLGFLILVKVNLQEGLWLSKSGTASLNISLGLGLSHAVS